MLQAVGDFSRRQEERKFHVYRRVPDFITNIIFLLETFRRCIAGGWVGGQ